MGLTLTLPTQQGHILIALVALTVSFAGTALWNVVCFILHQSFSTQEAKDGLHHQRQVLFKSGLPASAFIWRLSKISW